MKKTLLSMAVISAFSSALFAEFTIKPDLIDAYKNSENQQNYKLDLIKRINPDESFKWHYARYFDDEHKDDLYLRDLDVYKGEILASGSYHSSLLRANIKSGEVKYNDFHAIKDAGHGVLGVKYAEAETDGSDDEWSGASELFVEQGEWIDKDSAFVNAMPKYLGVKNPAAKPYTHQSGIHKIKFDENKNISEVAFAQGEFYMFRKYKKGVIALGLNDRFKVFDQNLKLVDEFNIPNVVKADVAKDRLFVLIKGEKKGIYEYNFKKRELKKIAEFDAQFFGRPIKATTSPFLVSPNAKYIYYATPHNYNSKLCKVKVSNGKTVCGDAGFAMYAGSYAISPNAKFLAYTFGGNKGQTNLYNIDAKVPYLAGSVTGGVTSYAAAFSKNDELVVSNERRMMDVYSIKKDGKVSLEKRFDDLSERIFDFVSPNMQKITFKIKEKNGKKKIKTSLTLPQHIDGVNLTWHLPDSFKEFVNEKGKVIALPSQDYSGEISVTMELIKDGKVVKSATKSHAFKLAVKR